VPLAGSEAKAIRRVTLVQQEHKLSLSEIREACRALKAAADDSSSPIPEAKLDFEERWCLGSVLAHVSMDAAGSAALCRALVSVWHLVGRVVLFPAVVDSGCLAGRRDAQLGCLLWLPCTGSTAGRLVCAAGSHCGGSRRYLVSDV
jgi:hypothetical protein